MIARADIVAAARSLIGTPFRHQARLPGVGIDCLNLIGEVGMEEFLRRAKTNDY